jgi:hypothetical protein
VPNFARKKISSSASTNLHYNTRFPDNRLRLPTFIRDWIASWHCADEEQEERCQLSNILLRDATREDGLRRTLTQTPVPGAQPTDASARPAPLDKV